MKKYSLIFAFAMLAGLSFCSDDNDDLSGVEQKINVSSATALTVEEEEPEMDDNISVGETFDAPASEEPEVADEGTSNDTDGDGIPNDEDDIPDHCTSMVVKSNGVSSAEVILNDDDVYSPSDFHNKDFEEETHVNLVDGENTIFIRIAGSPGDQLNVRIYDCSQDPVELLYETTVTRTTGSPNTND